MNGDIAKLKANIEDLGERVGDLTTDLKNTLLGHGERMSGIDERLSATRIRLRELEDRFNQEESDREHADTALHDEIGRVERSQ